MHTGVEPDRHGISSLTGQLIHSFIHSFIRSFIRSFSFVRFVHSLIHSFVHSVILSFVSVLIHSCVLMHTEPIHICNHSIHGFYSVSIRIHIQFRSFVHSLSHLSFHSILFPSCPSVHGMQVELLRIFVVPFCCHVAC